MAMNNKENLPISLDEERAKRIHNKHESNLQKVRKAFEQAFPLTKKKKAKPKKKGK